MGPNYINPFDLIYLIGIIASICIIQSLKTKRIVAAFVAGVICWLILLTSFCFDNLLWLTDFCHNKKNCENILTSALGR